MRVLIVSIILVGLAAWWWVGHHGPVNPEQFEQRLSNLPADKQQLVAKAMEECGGAVPTGSGSAAASPASTQGKAASALPTGWDQRIKDPAVRQQVLEAWGQATGRPVSHREPGMSKIATVSRITPPGRLSQEQLVSIIQLGRNDPAAAANYIEFLDASVKVTADDVLYLNHRVPDDLIIKLIHKGAKGR